MANINSRLWDFISHLKLNANSFGSSLGYKSSEKIARLFRPGKEDANPSAEILADVAAKYPELNLNWLLTGNGDMLTKTSSQIDLKEDVKTIGDLFKAINSLAVNLKNIERGHELIFDRLDGIEDVLELLNPSDDNSSGASVSGKTGSTVAAKKGEYQKPHKHEPGKLRKS